MNHVHRRSAMYAAVKLISISLGLSLLSCSLLETVVSANASFVSAPSMPGVTYSQSSLALVSPRRIVHCQNRSTQRNRISPIQSRIALQVKLRDFMDDGKKKSDPDLFDISNLDRRTKLAHQLQSKSTPEIKRELEYTYGISTVALRGRDKLINALIDARLKGSSQNVSGVTGTKATVTQRTTATVPPKKDFRQVNMNHGPNIETMGVSEIKRELKLYGVNVDAFVEKRELMEALKRERQLRMPMSARPKNNKEVVVIPGVGNVSAGDAGKVAARNQSTTIDPEKQREMRIAYEFEHIQTSVADPLEILTELESQYGISTKYFSGAKEMAYALAVARVDATIESESRGKGQGSVIGDRSSNEPLSRSRNNNNDYSSNFISPTSEELVAMEYENLQSWDESDLAAELENQYGIPAKHFLGKKEMAYALAVERVEQCANEGGFIVDDDYYEQQEEEEDESAYDSYFQSAQEGWNTDTDATNYGNNYDMFRMLEEEMMREEEQERLRQMATNDPRSTEEFIGSQNQNTPLADMTKNNGKQNGSRQYPPRRTPLSSEQPSPQRQRQRQQNMGRGTVMGGRTGNKANNESRPLSAVARDAAEKRKAQAKKSTPLSDILKGAEEKQKARSRRVSTPLSDILKGQQATRRPPRSANDPYQPRNKPPPRPKATNTERFDDAFSTGGPFNNPFNGYNSRRNGSQMPFEPSPFTPPGAHNAAQGTASRPRNKTFSRSQKPYEPTFTPPRKHDTTNMPPPPKSRRQNSRKFNIKDGPDFTQPFVGSQVWVNENVPPSPPLQVEPPPRDPNYKTPERPFEPTPFSTFQPHSVRDDRPPNRREQFSPPPPPRNNNNYQSPPSSGKKQTYKSSRDGSSPFDKFKDAFQNMTGQKKKPKPDIYEGSKQEGYKSGNVEVLSDNEYVSNNGVSNKWQQQMSGSNVIDAEIDDGQDEESSYATSETYDQRPFFADAWKGGPQSADFAASIEDPSTVNAANGNVSAEDVDMSDAIHKAQELLANDPKLRYMASIAQSNPKVREAVEVCMGNPAAFGQYLNDPDIGPILQNLRKSI